MNKVTVLTGYARWFERYVPGDTQLKEAQETAREQKLGLWAEPMAGQVLPGIAKSAPG